MEEGGGVEGKWSGRRKVESGRRWRKVEEGGGVGGELYPWRDGKD